MGSNSFEGSLNNLGVYPHNILYEKYNPPLLSLSTSYFLSENLDNSSLSYDENEKNKFQLLNRESFIKEGLSTKITNLYSEEPKPKYVPNDSLNVIIEKLKAHNINPFSEGDSKLLEEKQVEKETLKQIPKEDQKEAQINDFIKIKRKRKNKSDEKQKKGNGVLGRRKCNDQTEKEHNKFSSDNIIKKIKKIFINNLINFVNTNIEKNTHEGKNLIKKLSYKDYTNILKVDTNREDLQKTVKEILSYNISSKYKNSTQNSNKLIIESILENYKNDNIIQFVFKLTMSDWIDIYRKNKNLNDFKDLNESEYNKIVIPDIDDLFNEFKDDKKYLAHLIYYLYNYENYFYNKKARKSHKKKKLINLI